LLIINFLNIGLKIAILQVKVIDRDLEPLTGRINMDIAHHLSVLDKLRHLLNPLHVYCRLTHLGISGKVARDICKIYEAGIYRPTLGR